jgi:hypothetical protein
VNQKRSLQIVPIPAWTWKRRLILFLSFFGGLWSVLDPLFTLMGGSGPLSSLGVWRYPILLIVSTLPVGFLEYYGRNRQLGQMSFLTLTIILTDSGTRLYVETPKDLRVEVFVILFVSELAKNAPYGTPLSVKHLYKWNLLVSRAHRWVEVPEHMTINEAGLRDGDTCKIQGISIRGQELLGYIPISKLRKIDLTGVSWNGVQLRNTDLRGIRMINANLSEGEISNSNLRWSKLMGADLRWTKFTGTDLSYCDLRQAKLAGTDLSQANLNWVNLSGATYDKRTNWPNNFDPINSGAMIED